MPPESYKVEKVLAGSLSPEFLLRIEFPSQEIIEAAFNDPDYRSVISKRDEGFAELSILIVKG